MFSGAGFFHFGCDHERPIESLHYALTEATNVSGALMVLPEGFNIRKHYRNPDLPGDHRPTVLRHLQELATVYCVTFVAGLIIRQRGFLERPPLSAAYLISRSQCTLMCYKRLPDNSRNYTPRARDFEISNPKQHNGHWIGALICRDAGEDHERCIALQERFDAVASPTAACRFLCIPGHMYRHLYGGGSIGNDVPLRPESKNMVTIMANSDPEGCRSFITDTAGRIVCNISDADMRRNKVVVEQVIG